MADWYPGIDTDMWQAKVAKLEAEVERLHADACGVHCGEGDIACMVCAVHGLCHLCIEQALAKERDALKARAEAAEADMRDYRKAVDAIEEESDRRIDALEKQNERLVGALRRCCVCSSQNLQGCVACAALTPLPDKEDP